MVTKLPHLEFNYFGCPLTYTGSNDRIVGGANYNTVTVNNITVWFASFYFFESFDKTPTKIAIKNFMRFG